MAQKCKACSNGKLEEINQALVESHNIAQIAREYGLTRDTLNRHKKNHLPQAMTKAKEVTEVARADNLLGQIEELRVKAIDLLNQAENAGGLNTALAGVREARACLELLAKIRGELAQEGAVNITISAEWIELRSVILQALDNDYPEAKKIVSEAIGRVYPNVSP